MKDRTGYEFAELVEVQTAHFNRLKDKLRPVVFNEVREYCLKTNKEARYPEAKHQVFRGQDIIQLVMDHPKFDFNVYPQPPKEETAEEMI